MNRYITYIRSTHNGFVVRGTYSYTAGLVVIVILIISFQLLLTVKLFWSAD